MSWLEFVLPLAIATAVIFVPGGLLALAAGARRLLLWSIAPAISIAVLSLIAIVFGRIGIRWEPLAVAVAVVVIAGLVWAARLLVRSRFPLVPDRPVPGAPLWTIGALAVAGVIIGVQLVIGIQAPDRISQTFDAFFHLNGIRYILETGSASSFDLQGLVLPAGQHAFYPAGWHAAASLVAAAGIEIPVAVNAVSVVIATLVWPAGMLLLVRSLMPARRGAALVTGVLAAAFPAFPLLMLTFGVLYPYCLALALLPAALGLGFMLGQTRAWRGNAVVLRGALLALALVGIAFAQSSVVFAWAALVLPLALWRAVPFAARLRGLGRVLAWIALVALVAVFGAAWIWFGRIGADTPWVAYTNLLGALGEALFHGFKFTFPSIVATVLALIGVIDLVRRREKLWFVVSWAITIVLFTVAAGGPSWKLRAWFAGLFYRDPPRLSALLVMAAVPMAVFGAIAVWRLLRRLLERRAGVATTGRGARVVAAAALLVLVLATQLSPAMSAQLALTERAYTNAEDAPILSQSERTLIERMPQHVPADAVVAGNPWTGAPFAYALTGIHMLNPHFNSYVYPQASFINEHLNEALEDPAVCEAVRETGVSYVLDFGGYFKDAGETGLEIDGTTPFRGLRDLEEAGVAEEVDREGDSVLYRITACG
ncbi:DUF6541 family protein [Agromyces mediolanus]|uniref:DUF6541 family protein n=1 Tax=Agromyces mediolanus TaxID=41986 RepID=UPI003835C287